MKNFNLPLLVLGFATFVCSILGLIGAINTGRPISIVILSLFAVAYFIVAVSQVCLMLGCDDSTTVKE